MRPRYRAVIGTALALAAIVATVPAFADEFQKNEAFYLGLEKRQVNVIAFVSGAATGQSQPAIARILEIKKR